MRRIAYRGHNPARDLNEPGIVAALEAVGASVCRLDVPCDLLVGFRGENYMLEVKRPKEKLNARQNAFWSVWRGRTVEVVRDEREALRAIRAIT